MPTRNGVTVVLRVRKHHHCCLERTKNIREGHQCGLPCFSLPASISTSKPGLNGSGPICRPVAGRRLSFAVGLDLQRHPRSAGGRIHHHVGLNLEHVRHEFLRQDLGRLAVGHETTFMDH